MTGASARVWTFAAVIVIIATVALGWFLGISPKLAEAARFETDRIAVAAQNQASLLTLEQLRDDFDRLDEYQSELEALQAEFPESTEYDLIVQEALAASADLELEVQAFAASEPRPASPDVVLDQFGQVPEGTLLVAEVTLDVKGDVRTALELAERLRSSVRFTLVTGVQHVDGRTEDERSTVLNLQYFMISGVPVEGAVPLSGETPVDEQSAEGDDTTAGESPRVVPRRSASSPSLPVGRVAHRAIPRGKDASWPRRPLQTTEPSSPSSPRPSKSSPLTPRRRPPLPSPSMSTPPTRLSPSLTNPTRSRLPRCSTPVRLTP